MNKTSTYKPSFSAFSTILVFVALSLMGAMLIGKLNIRLNPSRSLNSVSVNFYWSGVSARVMEQEVTSKLEGAFSAIQGVTSSSSVSRKGSGNIQLQFKKDRNLDMARLEIASSIRRVHPLLPKGVSYPSISISSSGGKSNTLLSYSVSAGLAPHMIQQYTRDNIAPKLSVVKGVESVAVYGATPFEYRIVFNNDLVSNLGLNAGDISSALNQYYDESFMGLTKLSDEDGLVYRLKIKNAGADSLCWKKIPVANINGRVVYLTDIANVEYLEQLPGSYYRINGLNTINMVISAADGVNSIKVADDVKQIVSQLSIHPYKLKLAYDASVDLKKDLKTIAIRSMASLLVLIVFVWLLSKSFSYLLMVVISLVSNLLLAVILYYFSKIEIHLYSLAGITVSFGIIIDNTIVMIDHLRHQKNKKAFLAILAATITTMGALSVIFFLDKEQQVNLVDFVWVVLFNLFVSLLVAWFLVPSLMEKMTIKKLKRKTRYKRQRRIIGINNWIKSEILFTKRFKWIFIIVMVLGFGIPVHLLPDKVEKEGFWANLYNQSLGSDWFKEKLKKPLEIGLGGSLRLFSENVFESSYYSDPARTKLYINGGMPEGCTVQQLNEVIKMMENFLLDFPEIDNFQTNIYSYNNARITVEFREEYENTSFPYMLKNMATSKATSLGGLDWGIYGVGQSFNNSLSTGYKNNRIAMEGYNYDRLMLYALQLKDSLERNARVEEVEIAGNVSWGSANINEIYFELDPKLLVTKHVNLRQFYSELNGKVFERGAGTVFNGENMIPVTIESDLSKKFNAWWLKNMPLQPDSNVLKVDYSGTIERRKTGTDIYKYDQQYRLIVAYDFKGAYQLATRVKEKNIEMINEILPVGYRALSSYSGWYWNKKDKKQYYLIFVVIGIIFMICAMLLESLLQPLAIISLIPVSFIGVFLTFYLFEFNFDQGGFASFILLCGITVNSALYIVNDYNNFKKASRSDNIKLYIKAVNHKIIPVLLTIFSTMLGLVPFVWGGQKEVFWFAFATGTIGGLFFSLLALFIYFPMFLKIKKP